VDEFDPIQLKHYVQTRLHHTVSIASTTEAVWWVLNADRRPPFADRRSLAPSLTSLLPCSRTLRPLSREVDENCSTPHHLRSSSVSRCSPPASSPDGKISWHEFSTAMTRCLNDAHAREPQQVFNVVLFSVFSGSDGIISEQQLKKLLYLRFGTSSIEDKLVAGFGKDGPYCVGFDAFIRGMSLVL